MSKFAAVSVESRLVATLRARHRANVGAGLERRIYEGVTRKLTSEQILDVVMRRDTYRLTAREVRVVRRVWGV